MLELGDLIAHRAMLPDFRLRLFALELAHARLGEERTSTKPGELVAQMPHELLELTKRKCFRTFAV
ncbi:MAG: hypothetical protein DMD35_21070 [Gemmatimonadetes bacterium]|nr:MAG: hypothetical protein DMD35_21070 [Gemmatimonadota bacterium]